MWRSAPAAGTRPPSEEPGCCGDSGGSEERPKTQGSGQHPAQLLARKGLTQNLPLATSPRGQPGASGQLLLPASRVQANDVQTDDGGLETVEDEVTGSERRRDVPMIHCDPETGRGPRDPASMALAQDQEGNTPSGYLWATGSLHM